MSYSQSTLVIQPLQNSKPTVDYLKTSIGTLNTENNFGEISQALIQIQKNPSSEISLRSDESSYSSNQNSLIGSYNELTMNKCNFLARIHMKSCQFMAIFKIIHNKVHSIIKRSK